MTQNTKVVFVIMKCKQKRMSDQQLTVLVIDIPVFRKCDLVGYDSQ